MITRSFAHNQCTTIDLAQFQSGRNLTPQQLSAKNAVERIQASMADLAAKDGSADDYQPEAGRVGVESSSRWDEWSGPRSLSSETVKFDPKTKSVESYQSSQQMESPYGDTGSSSDSFKVDSQGLEHYAHTYEFNGTFKGCCDVIIDKSGNLVQLFE